MIRPVPHGLPLTSTAIPVINADKYNFVNIKALATAITNWTITSTAPVDGEALMIRIYSAAAQNIAWTPTGAGAQTIYSGIVTLPIITVAGKTMTILLIYDSVVAAPGWYCTAAGSRQ
jgi:hypothetical protein